MQEQFKKNNLMLKVLISARIYPIKKIDVVYLEVILKSTASK